MKKILILSLIIGVCPIQKNWSQNTASISPELLLGKTFKPNSWFPEFNGHFTLGVGYEVDNEEIKNEWKSILNLASTGIAVYYSNFGNDEIVGDAISLIPFININLNKKETLAFKFGLGTSYFFKKYHPEDNPINTAVSTDFTWAFQAFLYYNAHLKNNKTIKVGTGYLHQSNGHVQLPNAGLNTVLLSLSTSFEVSKKYVAKKKPLDLNQYDRKNQAFYSIRYGQGFQKFYNKQSDLKAVNSFEIYGGLLLKNVLKLSTGITYSFYHQYYDYINETGIEPYAQNSFWNASNIYLSIGVEALLGRVGIDWEGGLNIYKPFYEQHYILEEGELDDTYELKKLFLGRLGLKLYAINTIKQPKNNFYLGVHIKSNLSQADYTEVTIGYTHSVFK